MVKTTHILGYRLNFVFRHKYEKNLDWVDQYSTWKEYRLGVWLKPYKAISKPENKPVITGTGGTLSKGYIFGVNLLVCKFWIDICYRPLTFSHE